MIVGSQKTFPASLDHLYDMLSFIRDQAAAVQFDPDKISNIELAAEETLVNIISYGYSNRFGEIEIICSVPAAAKGLKIVIKDRGVPYNPLASSRSFDPFVPVEQLVVGGYGIYFILKIMDEVDYKRVEDCNILTMIKFIS